MCRANPRFTLRLNAAVTNIVLDASGEETGVTYTDENGAQQTATLNAGGRVVLTAGALATPRLLMLSGIGPQARYMRSMHVAYRYACYDPLMRPGTVPQAELASLQATGRLNLDAALWRESPAVGAYLSDHVISTLTFRIPGEVLRFITACNGL